MSELGLVARPLATELPCKFGQTELRVVDNNELMSISYHHNTVTQIQAKLGALPEPGRCVAFGSNRHLLWTGVGQVMCYGQGSPLGEAAMSGLLGQAGYVTDITDGWIALTLEGPDACARVDLIAPPDLSSHAFEIGNVTSTVISRLRVIIWHEADGRLVFLSAASSANSLIHDLTRSLALYDTIQGRAQ